MATVPAPRANPPLANLRDIGGHSVLGGGSVCTGLLVRSTDLAGLDADGVERVRRLGIAPARGTG
jgi:hypothetical protein